jgi:kynurenine formamidase
LVAFDVMVTGELSQVGTQFDGLGHVGVRVGGRDLFYNGFDRATFGRPRGLTRLGVEKVGPIVTRGVLIDVAAFKQLDRLPAGYVITPEDLRGALARQGVDIAPGEVALIRTGYATLWRTDNAAYIDRYAGIGMAAAEWLASRQVVMVGADNAGVNVEQEVPGRIEEIHQVLIARYGIYLLENMNLESLASDQVYEFAFVFAPLKLTGAEGAPGSPLAIR